MSCPTAALWHFRYVVLPCAADRGINLGKPLAAAGVTGHFSRPPPVQMTVGGFKYDSREASG